MFLSRRLRTQQTTSVSRGFVSFGSTAMTSGKIIIGNNVFVAPNAIVTKDVEPNRIVAGIPAKILKETI